MTVTTLILLARVLHIVSSTVWAGFVMLVGFWFIGPHIDGDPDRARRLRQTMVNRAASLVAPAALVSVASGLYLFRTLHGGAWSRADLVLAVGAITAVLSFLVGAIGTGPPERRLAQLDALVARGAARTAEVAEIAALERRVQLAARVIAILLLVSCGAMAVARYL